MNQRHRPRSTSVERVYEERTAVRILPRELVAEALVASGSTDQRSSTAVVRPTRFEDVTEVLPRLKASRPVLLELDELPDDSARRRAMDFASGLAYGLGSSMCGVDARRFAFLLEPNELGRRQTLREQHADDLEGKPLEEHAPQDGGAPDPHRRQTCVLCDLRTADRSFRSPLDTVITRDGSRIWSPPAPVCTHCRETIRHWRFVLGWCPECERWGRRNVMSPCGIPYGS